MGNKSKRTMLLQFAFVIVHLCQLHCRFTAAKEVTSNHSVTSSHYVPKTSVQYRPYSSVNTVRSTTFAVQDTSLSTTMLTLVQSITVTGVSATGSYYQIKNTSVPNLQSLTKVIQPTSTKSFKSSTITSLKGCSDSPISLTPTLTPTPTMHQPKKTNGQDKPILHKVGLIVGVVLGMVIFSVCLIIFHKKEARIKCLKLLCKPCTKNYSRYNIVPIYVYDDNEQDIRELQDDSDLPLV